MRGLYIHIPFCNKICNYCDFCKMVSSDEIKIKYINRLIEEIKSKKNELIDIDTVFIGGGTPNCLNLELLDKLLKSIEPYLKTSKESTIELNPDLITIEQIKLFKKYGINRISLGVESFNNDTLKIIGRTHTKEIVYEKIKLLKDNGFNNINIDLIFGLPNETLDDIKFNLNCFKELDLNHLSYYSLILEDKTIFSYLYNNKKLELPDDDLVSDMYDYINSFMNDNSYHHYEISNYSKPGYESIHNMKYWTEKEYVGIGLNASGFIKPYRYTNTNTMKEYLNEFKSEKELIDLKSEKNEYLMLGFRLVDGIKISEYNKLYNSNIFDDFNFDKLLKKKLIIIDGDYLKVSPDKLFVANLVFEEFIDNE